MIKTKVRQSRSNISSSTSTSTSPDFNPQSVLIPAVETDHMDYYRDKWAAVDCTHTLLVAVQTVVCVSYGRVIIR